MTSGIIDEVALLTSANAATVLANTKALAQSDAYGTTPFSPFLSTNRGWAVSTPFAVGEMIVSNGNIYRATAAGTSASTGGGPAGTGTGIVDNGVTWDFVQQFLWSKLLHLIRVRLFHPSSRVLIHGVFALSIIRQIDL
jgi:hypothetical protein